MASSSFTVHQSTLSELQGASVGIPGLCRFAPSSVCKLRKVVAKDGSPGNCRKPRRVLRLPPERVNAQPCSRCLKLLHLQRGGEVIFGWEEQPSL